MNDSIAAELVKAVNRVAAAYERMVEVAEAKQQRAAAPAQDGEEKQRKPKGDILTVTGKVLNFGVVTGNDGQPKLTKKKQMYWKLVLGGGFEAMVFKQKQADVIGDAFRDGLSLVIEYTSDGKYSNIENVKVAGGVGAARVAAAPSTLSCGHAPGSCQCAF